MTSDSDLRRMGAHFDMTDRNASQMEIHNLMDSGDHSDTTDQSLPEALRPQTDHGSTRNNVVKREATPFRPITDIPKTQFHSTGYHLIRPVGRRNKSLKESNNPEYHPAEIEGSGKFITDRHRSVDSLTSLPDVESTGEAASPRKRVPHDRRKGPSMTKQAVDYQERKVIEAQYKEKLAELIDDDIVQQVEDEGGITPLSRFFKANVRMLERLEEERTIRGTVSVSSEAMDVDYQTLIDVDNRLRDGAAQAEEEFRSFKEQLKHLLSESS